MKIFKSLWNTAKKVGKAIVHAAPKAWHGAKHIVKGVGKAAKWVAEYAPAVGKAIGGDFGQFLSGLGEKAGMVGLLTGRAQDTMNAGETAARGFLVDGKIDSAAMSDVVSGVKDTKGFLDSLTEKSAESASIKRAADVTLDAPVSGAMKGTSYVEKPGDESTYARYKRVKTSMPGGSGGATYNDAINENSFSTQF